MRDGVSREWWDFNGCESKYEASQKVNDLLCCLIKSDQHNITCVFFCDESIDLIGRSKDKWWCKKRAFSGLLLWWGRSKYWNDLSKFLKYLNAYFQKAINNLWNIGRPLAFLQISDPKMPYVKETTPKKAYSID